MKCPKCGAEMREKSGRYGRFPGMPKLATMQWNQGLEANRQVDSNQAKKTASRTVSYLPGNNQTRISPKTTTIVPTEHLPVR